MSSRCLLAALGMCMLLSPIRAQVYDDLKQAWEWEQGVRAECRAIVEAEPVDAAKVRAAIDRLRGLLAYFADPRTVAMTGDNSFRLQPEDIATDLAIAWGRLGEAAEVAAVLDGLFARLEQRKVDAPAYAFNLQRLEHGTSAGLRREPAVAAVLRKFRQKDPYARFRAIALATPFREQLDEDERMAGLALFWSEVKYNFANFDLVPDLDWDAAFLQAIPAVRQAPDTLAYYRVLQALCAQLRDGHTNVNLPDELLRRTAAQPPLQTVLAEGRVFTGLVRSPQLRELGLAPGQEILRVDGEPVLAYAERTFGPYVAASTPQDRSNRLLVRQLLSGPPDQPVRLTIAAPAQAPREVAVPRSGHQAEPPAPDYAFALLPQNVALVTLNTFGKDAVAAAFANDLDKVLAADALILDVRDNGGGSSDVGYAILAHLTDQPFQGSRWQTPDYRPAFRAWGRQSPPHAGKAGKVEPGKGAHFDKPVAVLISPRTFSAAEDLAVAFDTMRRGPLVGEATGGSTGQPLSFRLPGGGSARVCSKRDSYADGREFVGRGVQPTVPVAPTVADVQAGRDTVLQRALEALGKKP